MTQLTKDQTFVQKEIDAGRMTPDEARVHPQRERTSSMRRSKRGIHSGVYTGRI